MTVFKRFSALSKAGTPLSLGLFTLCLLAHNCFAQQVQLVVSSSAGDRLTAKPKLHFQASSAAANSKFEIHDDVHLQTMDGFGASFLNQASSASTTFPRASRRSSFDRSSM